MVFNISGLKRTLGALCALGVLCATISCSSYNSTGRGTRSGLSFRAFISNPVSPGLAGGGSPALNVIDASRDLLQPIGIPLNTIGFSLTDAGMMSVSSNRDRTLVMSPSDFKLGVVDNVKESLSGSFTLPGLSESFFVWTDNVSAFAAIPAAPVTGQVPGVVEKLDTSAGTVTATLPIPGAHFLVPTPDGSKFLVFSDNSDTVTLITPSLLGANSQSGTVAACSTVQTAVCTINGGFDRPVSAIFDPSGATAYVLNCGAECGGTSARVSVVNLAAVPTGSNFITANIPLPGATTALLQGQNLYVAGTQPGAGGTLAVLNFTAGPAAVNCSSPSPTNCQIFSINDGYHTQMQISGDGQLFVGARACSTGNCLSILNTTTAKIVSPTATGNVTGIAPIPNRTVVYVCQGGQFTVYDTTTDQPKVFPVSIGAPQLQGAAIDVKVVDF